MVRINILSPKKLSDQHLIAEYNEILMLIGHVKKHPGIKCLPGQYCLGRGHITFFKNKLLYLSKRHEMIKKEMKRRGFNVNKKINLKGFSKSLLNDWKPCSFDRRLIRKRLIDKISEKPEFYRYCGKKMPISFFKKLIHS